MSRHPFEGEGFDRDRSIRFWDEIATDYEGGVMQGTIPEQIVQHLFDSGILSRTTEAVEFGCGPGTYSVLLSDRIRGLTCVDTSERMLSMLRDRCPNDNIQTVSGDFMTVELGRKFDVSVASLCPGSASKEGLSRLESVSDGYCVYIMWLDNSWDNVNAEIWSELGKDYSFETRKSRLTENNLDEMGREYECREFCTDLELKAPAEEMISKEARVFSVYGYDAEKEIRKVLDRWIEGDQFSFKCRNKMKLITWRAH